MRFIFLLIFVIINPFLFGQKDSAIFSLDLQLKNGIYTSVNEVLENNPKYPNCRFDKVDEISTFYYDETGNKLDFEEIPFSIFSIVVDGRMSIAYEKGIYNLIMDGAISVFIVKKTYNVFGRMNPDGTMNPGYTEIEFLQYFVDLKTGNIVNLNHFDIEKYLMRDKELYNAFSKLSNNKKKKTLGSYIMQYNARNPIYIKMN